MIRSRSGCNLRNAATLVGVLILAAAASAVPVQGQIAHSDPAGLQVTRAELEVELNRLRHIASDDRSGSSVREAAQADMQRIQQRLQEGDLRAGDRIALVVEDFPALSDTFNVSSGRSITLPEIGAIPVAGILRSELQEHLTKELGKFIQAPIVHARSLVRVQIIGAVARPGFYAVDAHMLVGDALMIAGGPMATAQLDRITIERGNERIWSREDLRVAIVEGRTLDQLGVRAGDNINVPQRSEGRIAMLQSVVIVVSGLASVILLLTR